MWNEPKLSIIDVPKRDYSLSVKYSTINKRICWISIIYGPTHYRENNQIWPELSLLSDLCTGV